jgi:hypothetical protein
MRLVQILLLLLAAVFFALHYVHLAADFPNYSPWMDWSKYTDEGWYGDAAIRHFQLGHWYVRGDFNPAAALPVWPFLEGILFHFSGVSLVAARALSVSVFGAILVLAWLLLRRWSLHRGPTFSPPLADLLLALNPFCFVFTRLAILEPMLILFTLAALLVAGEIQHCARPGNRPPGLLSAVASYARALAPNSLSILSLGILIPLMILTKTTAVFLLPAVFWLLFAAVGYRIKSLLAFGAPIALLATALWLLWFGLVIHPHYLMDYRYLFSANGYTGISRANAVSVLEDTVKDGMWMGKLLFPSALAVLVGALASWRRLRDYPLLVALILWAGGYAGFLAYHDNLQPRYYLVIAVPFTLMFAEGLELFLDGRLVVGPHTPFSHGVLVAVVALLVLAIALPDAIQTLHYVRHPDYTLLRAARQLDDYIVEDRKHDPSHSDLVLSISGSDLSLMTGLRSINDDFGTMELADRAALYRPGWYVAWNEIDDDKMDALARNFRVERVAEFPAMDDPDRDLLILYRLDDQAAEPPRGHRRQPIPRSLRTGLGQQPSELQLEH